MNPNLYDERGDQVSIDSDMAETISANLFPSSRATKLVINDIMISSIYPDGYVVRDIDFEDPDTQAGHGIEYYVGPHSNEYLKCSWKNHMKNGEGKLYNMYGELLFRGTFINDCVEGDGYIYHEGCVVAKCKYRHNVADLFNYIECTPEAILMVKKAEDGSLLYRGGFNERTFTREGWGAGYSDGVLKYYGTHESDCVVNVTKRFENNIMRELDRDNSIIYIGQYKDDLVHGFPRHGEGREYDNDILTFRGHYKNDLRDGEGIEFSSFGIANSKGIWKEGELISSREIDEHGFFRDLAFDGRSSIPIQMVNGVEHVNCNIRHMKIGDDMCNSREMTRFFLENIPQIEVLSIGSHCFVNVSDVKLSDLPSLTEVTIGEDCFTQYNRSNNTPINEDASNGSFYRSSFLVNRCPQLKKISCGIGSFSSYRQFSITNLPRLESLIIGHMLPNRVGDAYCSFCFYWAEEFHLEKLPLLEYVEIGCQCFHNVSSVALIDLPNLITFSTGFASFYGNHGKTRGGLSVRLLSLPSLSFVTLGEAVFYNIYDIQVDNLSCIVSRDQFIVNKDAMARLYIAEIHPKCPKMIRRVFQEFNNVTIRNLESSYVCNTQYPLDEDERNAKDFVRRNLIQPLSLLTDVVYSRYFWKPQKV